MSGRRPRRGSVRAASVEPSTLPSSVHGQSIDGRGEAPRRPAVGPGRRPPRGRAALVDHAPAVLPVEQEGYRRRARPRPPRHRAGLDRPGTCPATRSVRHVPSRNHSAVRSGWTSGTTDRTYHPVARPNVADQATRSRRIHRALQVNDARALLLEVGQARLELRDASFGGDSGIVGEQRSDTPTGAVPSSMWADPARGRALPGRRAPCLQVAETRKDHLMVCYARRPPIIPGASVEASPPGGEQIIRPVQGRGRNSTRPAGDPRGSRRPRYDASQVMRHPARLRSSSRPCCC